MSNNTQSVLFAIDIALSADFQHFEVTPAIGREFKGDIQLDEIMNAPNKEDLIKDLAYMGALLLVPFSEL